MRRVVPIDLGGSSFRCAIAPAQRPSWTADELNALVGQTAERFPDADIEIAFFHGAFPDQKLLKASSGHPLRLSCHPMDMTPERANILRDAGGVTVEIEALSLDPHVLRTCGRDYSVTRIKNMALSLRKLGFKVGLHLVPGLPGTDKEGALTDAEALAGPEGPWVDFVRIWPALGFEGTDLLAWAETGRWRPMDVGEAVDVVGDMIDICEGMGVEVARVGLQPKQDIPVSAHAGPVHPNLRGEVEARRFARRIEAALAGVSGGARVVVAVNPKDLHHAKGTSNINTKAIRNLYDLAAMTIETDNKIERGTVRLARVEI